MTKTYYINVFHAEVRNNSDDEPLFMSETSMPLESLDEARQEAIHYHLDLGYEYECTLTNGDKVDFGKDIMDEESHRRRDADDVARYGTDAEQVAATYRGMIGGL